MMKLELPETIRAARPEEAPAQEDIQNRIAAAQYARIQEGYTVKLADDASLPFSFFSEINVNNSRLFPLFMRLLEPLPEIVSFIFSHIDEEAHYSEYRNKAEVIALLSRFELELTKDGFFEFGIIYQDQEQLQEVFVKRAKYLQCWASDMDAFLDVMNEFGLHHVPDLNFMDEYPMVTEMLRLHHTGITETHELVAFFKKNL